MPISSPTERGRTHDPGFTLIEMLVVLAILGIAAAIAAATLSRGPSFAERARDAARLRIAIETARDRAMETGEVVELPVDKGVGPKSLHLKATLDARPGSLVFYPDGSSSGGTILLGDRPILAVDWWTGAVVDAR